MEIEIKNKKFEYIKSKDKTEISFSPIFLEKCRREKRLRNKWKKEKSKLKY